MGVIAQSRVLGHRLRTLERRRAAIVGDQRRAVPAAPLPHWAVECLEMIGMTAREIEIADNLATRRAGDPAVADVDRAIEAAEAELLRCSTEGVEGLQVLAESVLARLRRTQAAYRAGLVDDAGHAQALALCERLLEELRRLEDEPLRQAG
jgi:hypothetical protein